MWKVPSQQSFYSFLVPAVLVKNALNRTNESSRENLNSRAPSLSTSTRHPWVSLSLL